MNWLFGKLLSIIPVIVWLCCIKGVYHSFSAAFLTHSPDEMKTGLLFLFIGINIGLLNPITLILIVVASLYGNFLYQGYFYFPVGIVLGFCGIVHIINNFPSTISSFNIKQKR